VDALDVVFVACNVVALAGWVPLVCFPRARATAHVARTMAPALVIAAIYGVLVVVTLVVGGSDGDFFSLDGVARLFDHRTVLLAGWIHYLAFDLVVGCWMWRRARELGIRHAHLVPCLLLTLWVGPVGLVAFTIVRAASRSRPKLVS